jgi:starch-binding outer membrane protein, SusD/RagB family
MLRRIITVCAGTFLAFTMVSCELEQEVLTGITQERLINEAPSELAEVLKQSAYTRLMGDGSWGGHGGLYSYQVVTSDEAAIPVKGGDWADGGTWVRAHRHTWQIGDGELNGVWDIPFRVIAEANALLQQYPDIEELAREMKVLRAFCYLVLLDNFGGAVPLIVETTTDPNPPSSSRQELFSFIESSVLENGPLLTRDNTRTNFNYWTAHMILAKLYLNAEVYTGQPKWAEAEAMIDVIMQGPYGLSPNYFQNFATANSNSPENMFTLPYDANNAGGFNIHHMTFHYESQKTFNLVDQPWNGYAALEEFYNSYSDTDLRKNNFREGLQFALDGTVLVDAAGFDGDPDGPQVNFTPKINQLEPNAFRQAGTRINKFEIAIGAQPNLNNDFPVFRYADVILMKAEVRLRQGDAAGALPFVNQIRERAGVPAFTSVTLDNLLAERGREMFAEGWRRSDLIRFGRFGTPWWEKPSSNANRQVFPVPLVKIQANTRLVQNPGY